MERLLAQGAPALSMYRMRDENSPEAMLSINYLSASHIEIAFTDGTVSVVTAAGDAKGVYLQPEQGPRPSAAAPAADTTITPPQEPPPSQDPPPSQGTPLTASPPGTLQRVP
jgi:hypothetical protein